MAPTSRRLERFRVCPSGRPSWPSSTSRLSKLSGDLKRTSTTTSGTRLLADLALSTFVQTIIEEQVICGLDTAQALPSGHVNPLGGCESRGGLDRRLPVNREPDFEVGIIFENQRRSRHISQRREREQCNPDPSDLFVENCSWQHKVRDLNLSRDVGRIEVRGECVKKREAKRAKRARRAKSSLFLSFLPYVSDTCVTMCGRNRF